MLNSVEIQPVANAVTISLVDGATIPYFLNEATTQEEHKEAGSDV